jgi:hypothetical protein
MQGMNNQVAIHVPGAAAANLSIVWTAYRDLTLLHVSAVGSNANDATLMIGTTSDTDAYMSATAIGDSKVPVEFDKDDFIGEEHPHIPAGTVVELTVDYDGASGTAVNDLTIILTFSEG